MKRDTTAGKWATLIEGRSANENVEKSGYRMDSRVSGYTGSLSREKNEPNWNENIRRVVNDTGILAKRQTQRSLYRQAYGQVGSQTRQVKTRQAGRQTD